MQAGARRERHRINEQGNGEATPNPVVYKRGKTLTQTAFGKHLRNFFAILNPGKWLLYRLD